MPLVGNYLACHLEALGAKQLLERVATSILARSPGDAVRDRQDGGSQASASFVFSTSVTSAIRIDLSTAFAMS
jgi:hypothetical protein